MFSLLLLDPVPPPFSFLQDIDLYTSHNPPPTLPNSIKFPSKRKRDGSGGWLGARAVGGGGGAAQSRHIDGREVGGGGSRRIGPVVYVYVCVWYVYVHAGVKMRVRGFVCSCGG